MGKFSIPLFLLYICALLILFYGYIGVSSPGGRFYIAFLDHHLNIISWFTSFLAHAAGLFLTALGYKINYIYPETIRFANSVGVKIGYSCLGAGIMSFWIAFVAAHKARFEYKFLWILCGVGFIIILNILRIAFVALANHNHYIKSLPWNHHTIFNIIAYIFIFFLMFLFIRSYKKYSAAKI